MLWDEVVEAAGDCVTSLVTARLLLTSSSFTLTLVVGRSTEEVLHEALSSLLSPAADSETIVMSNLIAKYEEISRFIDACTPFYH